MRACVIVLIMVIVGGGCRSLPEPVFSPGQPYLKVVTYNVNWGFARPQKVVDYLVKADADVVFLQETHRHWEVFLKGRIGWRYPHCIFEGRGRLVELR